MENDRGNFAIIVTGYKEPTEQLLEGNPGLRSRFDAVIEFSEYGADELEEIFTALCSDYSLELSDQARGALKRAVGEIVANTDNSAGSAREVRSLVDSTLARQAQRISQGTDESLLLVLPEDILGS